MGRDGDILPALREPLGVRPAPAAGRKSNGLGSSFVTCAPLRPRGLPWAPGGDKASASRRSVDSGAQGLRGHMFASGQKRVGGSWRILTQFRRVRSPRNGQRDQSAATRPAAVLTRACPCLVPGVGWSCTGTRPPVCRSLSAAGRGAGTGGGAWGHRVVPQDEGVSQRAGPSEVRAACPGGHQSRTQGVSGLPTQRLPWTRTLGSLSGRHPWEDPVGYPPRRPGGSPWALSPAAPTLQASASVTDSPSWRGQ